MAHEAAVAAVARNVTGGAVRDVRALTGGISNETYLVRCAEARHVVVRVMGTRERAAGRAATEAAALLLVERAAVPAPRLLWRGRVSGLGWTLVCTRVPGRPTARPEDTRWLERLADVLAAIHGIRPPGRSLPVDPGPGREWLDRDPDELGIGPLAAEIVPALRARRDELALGSHVLTHGDFHPGNVHWRRGRVAGVIDWEMASRAPAALDVGYLYLDLALAAGRPAADRFLTAYERRAGPVHGLEAWLLLACMRPLPDPARWLPSYQGAGYAGLTPTLLRRRLRALIRSLT